MIKSNYFELEFPFKQYFTDPVDIIQTNSSLDLNSCFEKIEIYKKQGYYLIGYFNYNLYKLILFEQIEIRSELPLLYFAVFKGISQRNDFETSSFLVSNLVQNVTENEYIQKINKIKNYISKGETYEANFTYNLEFNFTGDSYSFYQELKKNQNSKYSCYFKTEDFSILSVSPELFFYSKSNQIITKPMKGTLEKKETQLSEKIKAENHIIVDLLRNDLGKISKFGSVKINSLLNLEEYPTLKQITSEISSELKESITFKEIIFSLFPSGSVTGAPKKRTLEILEELENFKREVYTGAIGIIHRDEMMFNLAIRTIWIKNTKAYLGVGSGIVYDSDPIEEWNECILKQKFFLKSLPIEIFTTVLVKRKTPYFLKDHLERLKKTANYFSIELDLLNIINLVNEKLNEIEFHSYKMKILINNLGTIQILCDQLNNLNLNQIKLADLRMNSKEVFLYHKTNYRNVYDKFRQDSIKENCLDYIFLNEKEEITEGTIFNIIIKQNNSYYTPPLEAGILPGILRKKLLDKKIIKEKKITIDELKKAEKIYMINSVRGILSCEFKYDP
jgi:para-aminobenzoate synthetase/4-amino-4-deoxychorismate lyase